MKKISPTIRDVAAAAGVSVATVSKYMNGAQRFSAPVEAKLKAAGLRVHADLRNEKITYKIREHSVQKLPYILVVGDKERDANTVAVRARGNVDLGVMSIEALLERLQGEVASKAK